MIDLADRRVVVTGGAGGIGAACCRLFARTGAAVLVHYRSGRGRAEALLAELEGISRRPHLALGADLTDARAVAALFARVEREWGRLDHLVNNAGVWVENPIDRLDEERLAATLHANVRSAFLCTREAVPLLRRSREASIVNITSTAAQRGEARYSPYAASKGALIAATKSWSTELAPGIRVNSVAPGWVDTEMCREPFADGGRARIAAAIPLGRVATPEDIAGPVVFLASSLARHVTGEVLNVNGGSVLAG